MDEKRDEFWNEFYKDIPELDPREKEEPAPEAISGCLTIEYINSDGETVGETETVELQTDTPEEVIPEIQAIEPEEQPYQPAAEPQPASEEPQELAFPEDFAIFQPAPEAEEPKISGEWNIETPITVTSEPEPEPHEQKKRKAEEPKIYDPFSDRKFRREQRKKEKKFEVDFDFDEKYPDVNEKIIKQGSVKRTGLVSGILYFIFIVCISVVLAALGWMWATDVLGLFGTDEQITVTVPREIIETKTRTVTDEEGNETEKSYTVADVDYVAEMLYDSGLIKYKWLFKLYCGFSEAAEKVKAGTYVLTGDYDYRALVNGMTPSAGARVEVSVTIPEGHNIFQVVQDLVRNGVCDEEELWDCLTNYEFDYDFVDNSTIGDPLRLEGYLFPDTYTFYVSDTPSRVITKLLNNFKRKWTEEMDEEADALGLTQREVLTVASMIEKEAGDDSERARIASVIYNRLRDGGAGTNYYLQIDATYYYAAQVEGVEPSVSIDSPYNTYQNTGLPIGPITNPGLASIKAALSPEETGYYYYALGKEGVHSFFTNREDFSRFVNSDEYGG